VFDWNLAVESNIAGRFFRDITTERLRRGVFTSASELVKAIDE
jgi:hypothetical protein